MKKIIALLSFSFLFSSCKFDFEERDLTFYNNYKVNQLLLFKSNTSDLDTFRITNKYIYYNDWAPLERDGTYNPPKAIVNYERVHSNDFKTLNLNTNTYQDADFLSFNKSKPENESASIRFTFQNIFEEFPSNMKTVQKEKIVFNGKSMECFFFTEDTTTIKPNEIKKIDLDSNLQIVQYEWKNGKIWFRTN